MKIQKLRNIATAVTVATITAVVAAAGLIGRADARQASAPSRGPEIQFQSVPDPLKLPPDMNLGEVAGVAVNS
jgi:hypothetical protein